MGKGKMGRFACPLGWSTGSTCQGSRLIVAFDCRIRGPCWTIRSGAAAPVPRMCRGCFVFQAGSGYSLVRVPGTTRATVRFSIVGSGPPAHRVRRHACITTRSSSGRGGRGLLCFQAHFQRPKEKPPGG